MYIYGKNVVKEYIKSNKEITKAYVYKQFNDEEILRGLKKELINYVDKNELDKMIKGNHQGIILVGEDYRYTNIDDIIKDKEIIVMLDHIEDPHNFGAIIRTCEAAGVSGIIIPKNRSVEVTETVIRTSVGASNYVKIALVTNLSNTIKDLKKKGYWLIGTDMDGTNYKEIDYQGPVCIVIGSEGKGMSRIIKEACDYIATIPMKGRVNSLNASVAAGIIIYEAISRRL
ncbi:MAG: 23S rRNA (guanosine(2251)-2'-O)-methyltransferase RlmB [Bacilli bacterium]|nr:23S rRNA (guanosine(2251)-2'-O)-methyltransferase RlmB [Bacilli bacterium]MDD4808856.1 23S rRNA (guanosine(2251)-2'-O)-methyltransferase RlmB [Bacilli bacterium]